MLHNLPKELKKYIATYFDTQSLYFFSQTNKANLQTMSSVLITKKEKLLLPPSLFIFAMPRGFALCIEGVCYNWGVFGNYWDTALEFTKFEKLPKPLQQM